MPELRHEDFTDEHLKRIEDSKNKRLAIYRPPELHDTLQQQLVVTAIAFPAVDSFAFATILTEIATRNDLSSVSKKLKVPQNYIYLQ